ncbi:hypothetical protein NG701_17220 [Pseudarthrobacter sp. HLT3-5]|uniref:hypothetical protein n=1 Tax=Pseudarthrobacter cellobiosi TaxID=2953654 RepID=UPI00208EB758|nr:hypothetical protein [Pseudarthrobacter sp. HLT3-5]MCO4276144.1 hypothetical protein [Pseudarthrobacter sp. HLT3-5]
MRIVEETHPYYKRPVYELTDIDDFQPSPDDDIRIYQIRIGDGMTLGFMVGCANSQASDVLRITLHGAKGGQPGFMFHRFTSSVMTRAPFLLFADPTLTLDESNLLAWYAGTPKVNPDDWMELITRKVMAATSTVFPVFDGSSGGGFTAMRLATRFGRSVAVSLSGQTDIFRYYHKRWAEQTIKTAFPGMTKAEVADSFVGRTRAIDLYTDPRWNRGNMLHLVQNIGDQDHVKNHMNLFLNEIAAEHSDYVALDGRVTISRPYVGEKHIATPLALWDAEVTMAIARLKDRFKDADLSEPETAFEQPTDWAIPDSVRDHRRRCMHEY